MLEDLERSNILKRLSLLLTPDQLTTRKEDLDFFGNDWTRFYQPNPMACAFPRDIDQVVALVRLANELEFAIVPSGGRTGLSGGAVAAAGELLVSFERMNQLGEFNPIDATLVCQPGVVTERIQEFAKQHNLCYPVDFASAGSSQIGGNIATNAGGIKVIRYGLTRDWVAGLKVVTGKGDLLDLNRGLVKNATGYDLRHLFIGSEGTLGLIVEARIRLAAAPGPLQVMLLAVPSLDAVMVILERFKKRVSLTAFEFFSDRAMQHVRHAGLPAVFAETSRYYVLLEYEEVTADAADEALQGFEECMSDGLVVDGVLSQSQTESAQLWRYRENISESITPHSPWKNDISVRISRVPAFLEKIEVVVSEHYPDFELVWFGHIGDGNLHLNILKPQSMDIAVFKKECEQVNRWVYRVVEEFEGSISAEHGIGLLKQNYLSYSRSVEEIEYMRGMKAVFDPNSIMNPGKLLAEG